MVPSDTHHPSPGNWKLIPTSLLVGLLAWLLSLLALGAFHRQIAKPFPMQMDHQIQEAVHGHTTLVLTRIMFAFTWIGSPKVLFPVVPLLAALLWWRRLRHEAVLLLVSMAGAGMLNSALKVHFHRSRPDVPWALVQEGSFSFPSGHSVFAVVLYGTLVYLALRYLRRNLERVALVSVAWVSIAGIGLSRIYLGAHYPSDVAAGYFVGCMWLITVITADWIARMKWPTAGSR